MLGAARCLLLASWHILWFDVVADGRKATRNCNNQVAGHREKSTTKAEFQSWERNVAKIRQYSRDGEWTAE